MAPRKLSVPTVESSALPAQAPEDFDPVTSGLMYARKLTATKSLKRRDDLLSVAGFCQAIEMVLIDYLAAVCTYFTDANAEKIYLGLASRYKAIV